MTNVIRCIKITSLNPKFHLRTLRTASIF